MRNTEEILSIVEKLDDEKRLAVKEYAELLLDPIRYQNAKSEIESRRNEALSGETLTEDEIWMDS